MSNYLLIGDVHCVESDIKDCEALAQEIIYILRVNPDTIPVFLGDLYDSFAIIKAEVQKFWHDFLEVIKKYDPILLAGNHDLSINKNSKACALLAHKDQARVVLPGCPLEDNDIVFNAYEHDLFVLAKLPSKRALICHQTFQGAQYENGFYAKDGIPQEQIASPMIVSGHIHKPSKFGKVQYIGSPRWLTRSDANESERYLWFVSQNMQLKQLYPTGKICRKIQLLEDREEHPLSQTFDPKDIYHIDVIGSAKFVNDRKGLYPFAKVRVDVKKECNSELILSDRDTISSSLNRFTDSYEPQYLDKEKFKEKLSKDEFYKGIIRS